MTILNRRNKISPEEESYCLYLESNRRKNSLLGIIILEKPSLPFQLAFVLDIVVSSVLNFRRSAFYDVYIQISLPVRDRKGREILRKM